MTFAASKRRRPSATAALGSPATLAAKQPGAWRDRPLPPNTPAQPYCVRPPVQLRVVNATPAQLRAALAQIAVEETPAGAQATIPRPPAPARAALPDLSRAVLDRTLATLHTPTALAERVEHYIAPRNSAHTDPAPVPSAIAARLAEGNGRISGRGTATDPWACSDSRPLYLTAPTTICFVGLAANQLNLAGIFGLPTTP